MTTPANKSNLRVIRINYGGEKFKFDIFKDLDISVFKIQEELQSQASNYSFALLLQKKLLTKFHELKEERKALAAKLYLKAKEETINGRIPSDDYCNAKKESSSRYRLITKACIVARDHADSLFAVIKGYEQRQSLLQTISANSRKEKD